MKIRNIRDSFANVLSGIGMSNPKTASNGYVMREFGEPELEAAYRSSTWFGKIVEIPADDAVREWRNWQTDKETINKLTIAERKLGVRGKIREAIIAARTYGGAVIYLGGLPGDPSEPVDVNRLKAGDLKYMTVFNRFQISAGPLDNDPASPYFRQPREYTLNTAGNGGQIVIHASRMVRLVGRQGSVAHSHGWGDPIWMHLRDAVTNADSGSAIIASLLIEAKTDVVRMADLMSGVGTDEYTKVLIERFQSAQLLKSVTGVMVLDKDDEWDQKQVTWTGLPDVVRLLLVILAGAADIPVTRLIGTSATGLNATGEGDLKNYYDKVRSHQENEISPALTVLDNIIVRSALGSYPDELWYQWAPLWQPTEKERAERNKINAESDRIYADSGLVPTPALARAVQNRLIESGEYPGLDEALADPSLAEDLTPPADDDTGPPLQTADAAPETLYVSRRVLNVAEITKWAKAQGFKAIEKDLHVTIIYTPLKVDWMKAGENWHGEKMTIDAGGPRVMEYFGEGAKV